MNEELLKSVLSDSDFAQKLLEMESPEEVQSALKNKGIDLTLEDIHAVQNILANQENGELNEDELENVAGGSLTIMGALGVASIISACCGGAVSLGNKVDTWTRRRW